MHPSDFLVRIATQEEGIFFIDSQLYGSHITNSWTITKAVGRFFSAFMIFPGDDIDAIKPMVNNMKPGDVMVVSLLDHNQLERLKEFLNTVPTKENNILIGVLLFKPENKLTAIAS